MNSSAAGTAAVNSSWWGNNENKSGFLLLPLPLTNFKVQICFQNEPKFNIIYSKIIYRKQKMKHR